MPYTYDYARPAVAVDCVILAGHADDLRILLIQRKYPPFRDQWALPGGFLDVGEDPADAAARELHEETSLTGIPMTQVGAFGAPDRDPREHVVSIAYLGRIDGAPPTPTAADDARNAQWFPLHQLPPLAFDHPAIIAKARAMP